MPAKEPRRRLGNAGSANPASASKHSVGEHTHLRLRTNKLKLRAREILQSIIHNSI